MICFLILLLFQVPSADLHPAHEAIESREYRRASRLLDSILESDTTQIEARYLRGIALRERGRNPTLNSRLQRYLTRGARDFEFVISQDSGYQEVLLEFAILKSYQGDLQQAILLAEAQLQHRPELEYTLSRLLSFYWRYVVTKEPEEARQWLRKQSGSLASLFVGRTYERQGMYDAAELIYRESEEAEATVTLLSRARLEFAQMRLGEGTQTVQQAISNLNSKGDAFILFEEIKTIASPSELVEFEEIEDLREYRDFFNSFWSRRDPMPAAPYNARMAEHYRRLRIAEQDYLFNGFRSWFRSDFTYDETHFPSTYPFSSDFTDRGVIFIRHGEPDDYTVGEANSWLYYDSSLVFHFAPTCIGDVCGTTDHFVPAPRGLTFAPSIVGLDELDAERVSMRSLADGLSSDRHQWPSGTRVWEVPFVMAAFRGADGQTLLEIYYEIPLHETTGIPGPDSVLVESGFAVHTDEWDRRSYIREQNRHARGAPMYVDRFQIDLPSAHFNFALHTRVVDGVHLQANRFYYRVPAYSSRDLQLSDILLADSIDALPDAMRREDLILHVNPSGKFRQTAAPFVYFEIYNLERDQDGQTRYRIAYTLTPADERESGTITLQTSDQRGVEASEISYISVDLSQVTPRDYILNVEVEDLVTEMIAQTSRKLTLR